MTTLSEILNTNHYALSIEQGQLQGPAAEFLAREAAVAQFFLFGEEHGVGDNLQIATALFQLIQPAGYTRYATEIGPQSALHINHALQQKDSLQALNKFYALYPFAIPFDWLVEEVRLLQVVYAANPNAPVVGIDQEFILSGQVHLETLLNFCTDEAMRAHLTNWLEHERTAIQALCAGTPLDQLGFFLNKPLPPEWTLVQQHFATRQHHAALALMEGVTASNTIYQHYENKAYYENNLFRTLVIKKYFIAAYQEYPNDKYFIKLGANHVERGHSSMGVYDIGNFIGELAVLKNTTAFNLYVAPVGGQQNMWLPFLPTEFKAAAIEPSKNLGLQALLEAASTTEGWHLYDLRPLRRRLNVWSKNNPDLKKLILGYDAVLFIHNPQAAQLLDSLTQQ